MTRENTKKLTLSAMFFCPWNCAPIFDRTDSSHWQDAFPHAHSSIVLWLDRRMEIWPDRRLFASISAFRPVWNARSVPKRNRYGI